MRLFLILIISIWTLNLYSQIEPMKIKNLNSSASSLIKQVKTDNDTIPSVIYETTNDSDHQPAYFINGKYATETILKTIAPQFIDSIYIVKEDIKIEDKTYNGQLHIQLKKDYIPKFISLTDLKLKYWYRRLSRPC